MDPDVVLPLTSLEYIADSDEGLRAVKTQSVRARWAAAAAVVAAEASSSSEACDLQSNSCCFRVHPFKSRFEEFTQ